MYMIEKLLLLLAALILVYVGYTGIMLYRNVQVSKTLIAESQPYSNPTSDTRVTLLVLGDSTAVGVGAIESTDTVAALFAERIGATSVENYAVSGAKIADLHEQIAQATQDRYDYILMQVGGNDIIAFHSAQSAAEDLEAVVATLPETENLLVLSAGNVGGVPLFPWFIRPFYTARTLAYHDVFTNIIERHNGTYVNLYIPPNEDPFVQEPNVYLAADGLHPSSKGYAFWFIKIVDARNKQ